MLRTHLSLTCLGRRLCAVVSANARCSRWPVPLFINIARTRTSGGRYLTDVSLAYVHNNWDNVEWDEQQEKEARETVAKNSSVKAPSDSCEDYENNADRYWDDFYSQHQNRFFKDRHWLFTEFPELAPVSSPPPENTDALNQQCSSHSEGADGSNAPLFPGHAAKTRILEVGCGVGNTIIPVLQTNNDPQLFVYGCDLSSTAVELLKEHKDYERLRCHAFVCDISDPESQLPFPDEVLDIVVCIFVLSAIHPDKLPAVVKRLSRLLKPGGLIVFRDYGRYDLTQLRFKQGRCLGENHYVRGDGTTVYFFTQDELRSLFVDNAGLIEEQNYIDRRLQVNRSRQLKMYRVWIQCKFRKPVHTGQSAANIQTENSTTNS